MTLLFFLSPLIPAQFCKLTKLNSLAIRGTTDLALGGSSIYALWVKLGTSHFSSIVTILLCISMALCVTTWVTPAFVPTCVWMK